MNGKIYLCWLMNKVQIEAEGPDGYLALCEVLQSSSFLPLIDMDWNRNEEGLSLRNEWVETECDEPEIREELLSALDREIGDECCTMMELMVVLAQKMEYEMLESPYDSSIRKWFTELMANADLDWRTNDQPDSIEEVGDILDRIIMREYDWDGRGGFFPMDYSQTDQRKNELVIQMNNYLQEKYEL